MPILNRKYMYICTGNSANITISQLNIIFMYRIFISDPKDSDFGLKRGLTPCEFYLSSADDICKVMKELSSSKLIYNLQVISVSSVDDVLDYFLLTDKDKKSK